MTDSKLTALQKSRKRAIALISNSQSDSVFSEEDRVVKKLRLASPSDKPAPEKKSVETTYSSLVNIRLSEQEAANLPFGRPLLDESEIIQCKHCKKPILRPNAQSHIKACLKVKAEAKKERKLAKEAASGKIDLKKLKELKDSKDADLDDKEDKKASDKPAKAAATASDSKAAKTASKTTAKTKAGAGTKKKADGEEDKAESKNSKKRKAADDDKGKDKEGPKTKKTKKEKPAPKPKGPVDVERQCGVPLPNGQLCARSLTCKSHSMGAKRAVQGRPAPYDTLLAAYQKKNQAKQQSKILTLDIVEFQFQVPLTSSCVCFFAFVFFAL
ncbi:phosphoribosylaminoimidazole carboxylase ade2, variant 2 [Orbilia ellipsospora]|uniref:Phosphoribosylaminoimidazole carboxylase ade2, variant 2 n=1 Tax=Orbilia ellipsospora TaxID=2528407 RepID=A0AAV9XVK7_9PEZI